MEEGGAVISAGSEPPAPPPQTEASDEQQQRQKEQQQVHRGGGSVLDHWLPQTSKWTMKEERNDNECIARSRGVSSFVLSSFFFFLCVSLLE